MLEFVQASFELGLPLEGQGNAEVTPREVALMFIECSSVKLSVNVCLLFTSDTKPRTTQRLIGVELLMAIAGLLVLSFLPA